MNETQQQLDVTSDTTEQFKLRERISSLDEARDTTLEQRQLEEVRELQDEDISRQQKLKHEWLKENLAGASSLCIGIASLISNIVIEARTAAIKGVIHSLKRPGTL